MQFTAREPTTGMLAAAGPFLRVLAGLPGNPPELPGCNCEHAEHFPDMAEYQPETHPYGAPMTSWQTAWFVGPVCDTCAAGHMRDYLRKQGDQ